MTGVESSFFDADAAEAERVDAETPAKPIEAINSAIRISKLET
jgi:hypothetical protein